MNNEEVKKRCIEYLETGTLRELSHEIEVASGNRYSPSLISLAVRGKYNRSLDELWKSASLAFRSDKLTHDDRRRFVAIKLILEGADSRDGIISALKFSAAGGN